jgi:hypothetical protein
MKKYGLAIALGLMFLGSWLGQWLTDTEGKFWNATFENWQSEFLQLLTFVVLSKYLIFRGSPQSRDGNDELQIKISEILRRERNRDYRDPSLHEGVEG